jgi:CO dehydrogenase/acetyl-CoA synthase beta subunit
MSLRRNQLKRMNLEQIMDQLQTETDAANIELINSYLSEKNQMIIDKKTALLDQL